MRVQTARARRSRKDPRTMNQLYPTNVPRVVTESSRRETKKIDDEKKELIHNKNQEASPVVTVAT